MEEWMYVLMMVVLGAILIFCIKKWWDTNVALKAMKHQYSDIIDIEAELAWQTEQLEELLQKIQVQKDDYQIKSQFYRKLCSQIELYEENLDLIEMGGVTPIFSYDTSEEYKAKIIQLVEKQKQMIKDKDAVISSTSWVVNGSKKEGAKFINQAVKLASRAFNNEANYLIKNVSWRNFETSEKKLIKAFEDINKFNASNNISITKDYLKLKVLELKLTYEQQLKLQEEKENLAEARRRIKEEEQLEADVIKAQKEQDKYLKLLEKAQKDAANKVGTELESLNEKIKQLNQQLSEAQSASERALSMAQQTKAGFVYIASNIGSFGEEVYKIGMTRRLEPMDRIKELSGASVPFIFDTHALIYSEDAPALETQLHQKFSDKRVNLVNFRKEYFRVTLGEIEEEVRKIGIEEEFFHLPEAAEYRQTMAIHKKRIIVQDKMSKEEFPEFI
ncbi:hypothetical protein B9T11_01920 [Wohlfahrtiimonas chitiniclastica]|uniref:DUF4041 domain-containing protein n=1 Tax=Wohlfahrtiimonas chitiniclastica TaxID=400946 RepID=UPI000B9873A3|nr:DUF4041 domain-containing protein [Wohlfahrtiimonas chitiniclastica]OYQ71234.1 hypothetical protein B9T13_00825 [Wohlfahrtiimonas chitiniclastica]OYQ82916.1 hypothetical protein B9T11_01920 [Wohlfahrtiimonas chitiniclastica]OYQ85051.1 hypothetical protein B9T14_00825 [Wohlfahrtiimonas chitiniclastica]OYQ86715.1 hypothetical protein B9T15_04215 [Wohlfahrtiimonas chitiniclastica]